MRHTQLLNILHQYILPAVSDSCFKVSMHHRVFPVELMTVLQEQGQRCMFWCPKGLAPLHFSLFFTFFFLMNAAADLKIHVWILLY